MCLPTYDIIANQEVSKNYINKEQSLNVGYFDMLAAKLVKETNPRIGCYNMWENMQQFQPDRDSLVKFFTLKEQEKSKSQKNQNLKSQIQEELKKLQFKQVHLLEQPKYYFFEDIERMSCFNYLYFFPEVFKHILSLKSYNSMYIFDFIINRNTEIKKFNNRELVRLQAKGNELKYDKFNETLMPYLYMDQFNDTNEKKVLKYESGFIKNDELQKFRNLSLGHNILYLMDKLVTNDVMNADKYLKVVCSGGVCNTPGLIKCIHEDIVSLIAEEKNKPVKFTIKSLFNKIEDQGLSIYKGANFISKLPELENVMITRQMYSDNGSNYLSYCYI